MAGRGRRNGFGLAITSQVAQSQTRRLTSLTAPTVDSVGLSPFRSGKFLEQCCAKGEVTETDRNMCSFKPSVPNAMNYLLCAAQSAIPAFQFSRRFDNEICYTHVGWNHRTMYGD